MDDEGIGASAPDAAGGRTASLGELRRRLPAAPAPYLDGAVDNPALTVEGLLLLLRNRNASTALLARIAGRREWMRHGEVRRLLVQHPQVGPGPARAQLSHLFWKDLLEVGVNLRAHPTVRRQAERMLALRIEELALGEKVALARRAPLGVLRALIHSDDARLLGALLGNPALTEADATAVAGAGRTPPEVLALLSSHPRWGPRPPVRRAVMRNPRTPVAAALRLLDGLPRRELKELLRDPGVPKIVRVGAERRLEASGPLQGARG